MKKGVIISLLIGILLINVISVSLVSAGLLEDAWNRITGRAVDNETGVIDDTETTNETEVVDEETETGDGDTETVDEETEVVDEETETVDEETEAEECAGSISISFNQDIYSEGDFYEITVEVFDSSGNPLPNYAFYTAMYDNMWHSASLQKTGSDGNYKSSGTVGKQTGGITRFKFRAYTQESGSCSSVEDTTEIEIIYEEGEEEEAGESGQAESEPAPETCAAEINVIFDKEVYYLGDEFEVEIGVFDSSGNAIPNYHFYVKVYDYNKGMWHTSSDEDRTDGTGYKIHKEKMKEGEPFKLGENKFKLYTKAYFNCNSVEDIVEIEIRKGEETEEVCGIGVCVPEEEGEVEEIPEEKILYACSGCKLEGKCYPFGYRKKGNYCSDNNEFIEQLEGDTDCDNSFECKSNICISDECVSEGLIKRIIKWFKKMFGGGEGPEKPGGPKSEECSELLIEKDIGKYDYEESGYGDSKEAQAPLYSEDGESMGTLRCCSSQYSEQGNGVRMAIVCPYDSRGDVENVLKWLSARGEINSGEYKGEQLYKDRAGSFAIIWAHKSFIIAVGGAEPERNVQLPEAIADAYLKKYKNDLGELPEPEPFVDPVAKEFLSKVEGLGELTLIDFEALPDGSVLQRADRLTGNEWESLGVVFEAPSEEYLKVFGEWHPFYPLDELSLSPGFGPYESGSDTHDDLTITFSSPVKAAGLYLLDLGDTDERESITFLGENNNIIEQISPWPKSTFGNPAPGTFVYLIADGISKIEILENSQDGDDIAYDNLYFVK